MCLKKLFCFSKEKENNSEISTLADYVRIVSSYNNKILLFRGQSDKDYHLIPYVGRNPKFLINEEQMFLEFKRYYYLYANNRPQTNIDLLFLAQHYGIPTRLLDWSYNPLVALYFACCSDSTKDGCVYIHSINPSIVVVKEGHELDNDIFSTEIKDSFMFLIPDCTDRRYLNQKGMFLWFKNPQQEFTGNIERIIIKNKKAILLDLDKIGITLSFIYPTLDNLCLEIKNKYIKQL